LHAGNVKLLLAFAKSKLLKSKNSVASFIVRQQISASFIA